MTQGAGDDRQHRVVERRAVDRLGGVVQGRQRRGRETHRPARADRTVERRARPRTRELATQITRQVAPPAGFVFDVLGMHLAAAHRLLGSVIPQQSPGVANRGRPVGQRVVDPPHQRALTLLELDHIHLPQRSRTIQTLLEQPGDTRVQPLRIDGPLMAVLDDVVVQVEAGVRLPGCVVPAAVQSPCQCRGQMDALGDPLAEGRDARSAGTDADHLARVAGHGRALQREDRPILGTQRDATCAVRRGLACHVRTLSRTVTGIASANPPKSAVASD